MSLRDAKCVIVIGATSGIGRDLAMAIHGLESKPTVIVAGRRQDRLDEIVKTGSKRGTENLHSFQVDINANAKQLKTFVDDLLSKYSSLDGVILSAAIQRHVDFLNPQETDINELIDEAHLNYTAVLTIILNLLPHFLKRDSEGKPSFIIPITSGLAFFPAPGVANYCATKAALHSLCISLRAQLRETRIKVMEIAPPLVESELHDYEGSTAMLSKVWMPLSEFTPKAMEGLIKGDDDIPVGTSAQAFQTYEKGKQERADRFHASTRRPMEGKARS